MADLSPELSEYYHRVRNDDDELNWLIASYEGPRSNKVILHSSGNGDIEEMKSNLSDDMVGYCYLRVIAGDKESRRAKFVFISWIGTKVRVMRKARCSIHKPSIKRVISECSYEMATNELGEINEREIMREVKKAGGADYSNYRLY